MPSPFHAGEVNGPGGNDPGIDTEYRHAVLIHPGRIVRQAP